MSQDVDVSLKEMKKNWRRKIDGDKIELMEREKWMNFRGMEKTVREKIDEEEER